VCEAMEVVIAENCRFSSRLCSDDSDECLSNPSDAALCGISVHQSRHILSTDVGIVEKCDSCVVNSSEQFSVSVTSRNTLIAESDSSSTRGEVFPVSSETVYGVINNCKVEDRQSTCTNDCGLSVSAMTDKHGGCDIAMTDPSIELAEPHGIVRPKSLCNAKKSVCFPIDDTDSSFDQTATDDGKCIEKQESKHMSLLLRLFESKLFDMAIALPYLFNSKEPGVLAYLGQYFCLYSIIAVSVVN